MLTVWKFPIGITERQVIYMPDGAELLDVQWANRDQIAVWARVRSTRPLAGRVIWLCGTGQPAPDAAYVGTVRDGFFVWHVFDGGPA